jgi:hypothetical protein
VFRLRNNEWIAELEFVVDKVAQVVVDWTIPLGRTW